MCGIVGYIGNKNASKELIDNLKKLEYRGYDSAGISTLKDNDLTTIKAEGKIKNLENKIKNLYDNCGIGHTRWATHGIANVKNAHPHLSENQEWACVHNGIVENYIKLKDELITKYKIKFKSETDSEVIPNLIQYENGKTNIEKIINACKKLNGSYALAILNSACNDTIYLAKNKSPLFVAITKNEVIIASDPICFLNKTDKYYCLNDNEFCVAQQTRLTFFNIQNQIIKKDFLKLDFVENFCGKENFSHFMLKEIYETPKILKNIIKTYKNEEIFNKIDVNFKKIKKIYLIGCGTAYHACLLGEKYIQKNCKIDTTAFIASEFRYSPLIIDEKCLCVFVSQSGETADTLACLELSEKMKAKSVALTNVKHSTLARKSNFVLPILAQIEIAVASTKAYTAQAIILYLFSLFIKNKNSKNQKDIFANVEKFVDKFTLPKKEIFSQVINLILNSKNIFFIGRDLDFISAKESALKLQEVSYLPCFALPAGELKHGYIALIDKSSSVITFATSKKLFEKSLNASNEAKSRNAKTVIFSQYKLKKQKDIININLPKANELLMPIVTAPYLQLLSYYSAITLNLNPDQPRNLAKSVTVE